MIITMFAMRMMQVPIDKIIDMVAMRHRRMPAAGTVNMAWLMAAASVIRGAAIGIFFAHFYHMPIHMIAVHVIQVTIDEIVDVVVMTDSNVAAASVMFMVNFLSAGHRDLLFTNRFDKISEARVIS